MSKCLKVSRINSDVLLCIFCPGCGAAGVDAAPRPAGQARGGPDPGQAVWDHVTDALSPERGHICHFQQGMFLLE